MNYELVYILSPKLSDEDAEKKASGINNIIKKEVEKLILEDFWGKKDLAYPIQNFEHGYYILVQFIAPPENIKKIDEELKLDDGIIRHLIVKREVFAPPKKEEKTKDAETEEGEKKKKEASEKKPGEEKISKAGKKSKLNDLDKKLDDILEKGMND